MSCSDYLIRIMLPHRRVIRWHVVDIIVMERPRATGSQPWTILVQHEPVDVRCLFPRENGN